MMDLILTLRYQIHQPRSAIFMQSIEKRQANFLTRTLTDMKEFLKISFSILLAGL